MGGVPLKGLCTEADVGKMPAPQLMSVLPGLAPADPDTENHPTKEVYQGDASLPERHTDMADLSMGCGTSAPKQ